MSFSDPGAKLAAAAETLVGTSFRLHGRDPATGIDCVGLVAEALRRSGREPVAPAGYRLRVLAIGPLLHHAEANALLRADSGSERRGDLLLVQPSPLQAHLLIAAGGSTYVHAHAGLGRVVRETGPISAPVLARWRLHTKD